LGKDPSDGEMITAKYGKFGPYIQKGEGDKRQFASLGKGQLIENITLEDALKLFKLPRTVGQYQGTDIIALKGKFGPYIKWGDKNFSLPRGVDPVSVPLEDCSSLIEKELSKPATNNVINEFKDSDIQVINGRYGPYIKHDGANYKIPRGVKAEELTEEKCKEIITTSTPTGKRKAKK
jgi:DNA topoisomerase-1